MKTKETPVVIVTTSYPDSPSSYRGKFVQNLTRQISLLGFQPYVLTARIFDNSLREEIQDDIPIKRFTFWSENKLLIEYKRIPLLRMLTYIISCFFATWKVIRKHKIKLIHAHFTIPTGFISVILARLTGIPVIVTAHGSDILTLPRRSRLLKNIAVWTMKNAHLVTTVAQHMTSKLREWGINPDKIHTIPMGIDLDIFKPENSDKNRQLKNPLIVSNRNLLPLYNVDLLIRSLPHVIDALPEVRLIIAGRGSERENLENLALKLGLKDHIEFVGFVQNNDMPRLLRKACLFISASSSDGTAVSLLEALACGTFPIVSDIPANREWIIHGENGLLFPLKSPVALSNCIIQAIQDNKLREKAVSMNREIVAERASWPRIGAQFKNLYQVMLNEN
ncbi:glycosyltransferase [bacterium]|nr:glycosyltransferase [bacterium]